ncbi:lipase family protein [Rhodococcus sp. NPDC058514]|uniref:lipase family protein n=1 Tax=unclassified Rhodococcus (in: high G+C Gram-positive bacteria) TaxID=192944 RepID=UPI0036639E84
MAVSFLAAPPATAQAIGPPGSVVGAQPLPEGLWIPGTGRGYRITYGTTDHRGSPALSSGAIYLPRGTAPPGGWPVVSYAHGTVGVADQCAPSTAGIYKPEADYLVGWLERGYAVVVTDYLGLGTPGVLPYLDGAAAAHSVIDMVRAARAVDAGLSRTWAVVGLSEGGHAALFTGRLATAYAPELDYRGAVALGAPSNLERVFPFGGPGFPNLGLQGLTTFGLLTVVGLRAARPDLLLDGYLSPRGRELADLAERLCSIELSAAVAGVPIGDVFSKSLNNSEIRSALADYLAVPAAGYDRPVFIGQGLRDLVVPFPLTLALVTELKANRVKLTFVPYWGADHVGTLAAAFPDTVRFVGRLMR